MTPPAPSPEPERPGVLDHFCMNPEACVTCLSRPPAPATPAEAETSKPMFDTEPVDGSCTSCNGPLGLCTGDDCKDWLDDHLICVTNDCDPEDCDPGERDARSAAPSPQPEGDER